MSDQQAWDMAKEILGYPCPCEHCSPDGGAEKAREIYDLACDLAGRTIYDYKP